MDDRQTRAYRIIFQRYDLEELRTLCFDLGVNYDDLPGEGRSARARGWGRRPATRRWTG
jgi:hypothetical protein